ncbi:MAG: D-glycero-beta-D-manno-heptose-7-phosphate kinase [Thermodesulfobacteriota bacterium]|nr:D-glycero-beta-D-manno-heptose-7-phosphate kinase [Thermodesulfobacteriota bacterium]
MKRVLDAKKGLEVISGFQESKVLVLGDIMLDEFIWGRVSRISPEAPVPVVNVTSGSFRLGGATNVVNNIFSLGAKVYVCGVVGDDENGEKLINSLMDMGIDTTGVIIEKDRSTSVKTRVIANNQQIVRYDREDTFQITNNSMQKIISYLIKNMDSIDAIIISDYGKGIVSEQLIREIRILIKDNDKIISVDPKVNHFSYYKGVTVITPNNIEASEAAGIEIKDEKTLLQVGEILLGRLACKLLLITRGEEGMTLFEKSGDITHIPTLAKEVYDVTGAGDTVISALTLALTAGASLKEASVIANYAAGIVVGEVGTAAITVEKLKDALKRE